MFAFTKSFSEGFSVALNVRTRKYNNADVVDMEDGAVAKVKPQARLGQLPWPLRRFATKAWSD